MGKKGFNFAEMEQAPIVQSANDTMVSAYEQPQQEATQAEPEAATIPQPIPPVNQQMQTTAQPATVPAPSVTADKVPAEVRNREEQLRNDYMVFLSTFGGSHMKRNNVEIPKGIHDRLTNIKSRLDDGTQGVVKLNLKELIQLAMLEFVEKYDRPTPALP